MKSIFYFAQSDDDDENYAHRHFKLYPKAINFDSKQIKCRLFIVIDDLCR